MRLIARDETKHAQLAWDIHAHLMSRLSVEDRQQIQQAQRAALKQVIAQANEETSLEHSSSLGYPPAQLARLFSEQLTVA